jgi:hypothetical protein
MMTLQLRRCVSLFLCLSLLLSACSPDKSNKAVGKVSSDVSDIAGRPLVPVQGLTVTQTHKNTDTSAGNNRSIWYPTWYTLVTEAVVGVTGVAIAKPDDIKEALSLLGAGAVTTIAAGEVARAVTTGFELGPVGGGFAGLVSGALTGTFIGAAAFAILAGIIDGNFNGPATIFAGLIIGAPIGGITGLATGIETGLFAKRSKKLDNQKQSANETTNNATTKDNPKAETGGAKA